MCDCKLSKAALKRLICIADFTGTCHHPAQFDSDDRVIDVAHSHDTGFWADYDPHTALTHYGGDWHHVPDLVSFTKPTAALVYEQANLYGGHCQH